MRIARSSLLAFLLGAGVLWPTHAWLAEREAAASVSIAVGYEALVKDADAVAIASAQDAKSVWEDGRIVTYTRVKVEQGVAGELGAGSEVWIRTLGGTVGRIGQLVDGEPNLAGGKPSLLFLHKFKATSTWEVSARAQGQFPILTDEASKTKKIIRAANVGVLLPPKPTPTTPVQPGSAGTAQTATPEAPITKLAGEVLHERPLEEAVRDIATTFRRLHPPTSATAPATK